MMFLFLSTCVQINNYALSMHLRQSQQGNSIPGHFHRDILWNQKPIQGFHSMRTSCRSCCERLCSTYITYTQDIIGKWYDSFDIWWCIPLYLCIVCWLPSRSGGREISPARVVLLFKNRHNVIKFKRKEKNTFDFYTDVRFFILCRDRKIFSFAHPVTRNVWLYYCIVFII